MMIHNSPKQSNCSFRVAVAAPSAPPASGGGVASAHYNLYHGLVGLGCDATLLTYNELTSIPDDFDILRSGAPPWLRSLTGSVVDFWLKLRGSRGITHQLHDIIASIPGAIRMNRKLSRLEPEFLIIPDRGAPGLCLRQIKARVIQVVHHVPMRFVDKPELGDFCRIDAIQATALEQRALRQVDTIVCPSDYMARVFREVYSFTGEVRVIPNSIDVSMVEEIMVEDVRYHLDLVKDDPVIYIPSAGSQLKGSRYVAWIISALADAYAKPIGFYLSGQIGFELASDLEQTPANARIYSPGSTSHAETLALLKSCSFGVSPTLIESFGMALLEAGCCGVPMVTFDVGGNQKLITDGESGFMVPYLDLAALLQQAKRLLNPGLCRTMRVAARRHVTQFNAEVVARQYLELFKSLS